MVDQEKRSGALFTELKFGRCTLPNRVIMQYAHDALPRRPEISRPRRWPLPTTRSVPRRY